jgi:hypothetical protein
LKDSESEYVPKTKLTWLDFTNGQRPIKPVTQSHRFWYEIEEEDFCQSKEELGRQTNSSCNKLPKKNK